MKSKNDLDSLCYMTECTLATVARMATRKRQPKSEYARQIAIAQNGISWIFGCRESDINYCYNYENRVRKVIEMYDGNVGRWAKEMEPTE